MKKNNQSSIQSIVDTILTLPQYLIPHHRLSEMMHGIASSRLPWLKQSLIKFVCWKYNVDLSEAADNDIGNYTCFNDFFTRSLKKNSRPIATAKNSVVSPVDGAISQLGEINRGSIIQAKNHDYAVESLLAGNSDLASQFIDGQFATIYLSPRDYHRIHMPYTGKLKSMHYVPGDLFSVSPRTARTVSNLFARNERLVCVFSADFGDFVVVLVGAIFVGSMETIWEGKITPPYGKRLNEWQYDESLQLNKGQEMGRFNMGSTVVILLPPGVNQFTENWQAGSPIKLGEALN